MLVLKYKDYLDIEYDHYLLQIIVMSLAELFQRPYPHIVFTVLQYIEDKDFPDLYPQFLHSKYGQ